MNTPHTLADQLAAALAEKAPPDEVDRHIALVERLLTQKRLARAERESQPPKKEKKP